MSGKAHKALYAAIPTFKCKEGCTECCGPVPFSDWEKAQIKVAPASHGRVCPYLGEGGCLIYDTRPFICRLFGTVPEMPCPHGCGPKKALSTTEGNKLLKKYRKLVDD